MRQFMFSSFFSASRLTIALLTATAATTSLASAEPISKDQLMTAPAGARHYTFSSIAGKHGDLWSWTTPAGRIA